MFQLQTINPATITAQDFDHDPRPVQDALSRLWNPSREAVDQTADRIDRVLFIF